MALGDKNIVITPATGTSGVWINLSAGTYKVNNFSSQTISAAILTAVGTITPTN